jgi:hypothetical protein
MTTPTATTTQKNPHTDSEQGMMIFLLVIAVLSVIGVILVGP